jgi:hypothetical protein
MKKKAKEKVVLDYVGLLCDVETCHNMITKLGTMRCNEHNRDRNGKPFPIEYKDDFGD